MSNADYDMPLIEHLKEFRFWLIVSLAALFLASGFCFSLYDKIFNLFIEPFSTIEESLDNRLFINYVHEGFLIKLKLSLIAGTVLSLPVHLYGIVRFIFPGLTKKERKIIGFCLFVSIILSGFGFIYGYFYIVPISIQFLTGSGFIPEGVGMLLSFEKNIFYIIRFLLGAIAIFQLPIILEILLIMNLISRKKLLKASKFVILFTFVLSALFTPPDFVSQIAVAVPLMILYFLALLIAYIFRFGKGADDV